jgi:hypothetical protein
MRFALTVFLAAALALITGCGTPGSPLPPSLHLPLPVSDLQALRQGSKVTLTWTQPSLTTDREAAAKYIASARICRSLDGGAPDCLHPVGEVEVNAASGQASFTDSIQPAAGPYANTPPPLARYAVAVMNARRKTAGPSNIAAVSLAYTWPPPSAIDVSVTAQGVVISWPGTAPLGLPGTSIGYPYFYRVLRSEKNSAVQVAVADLPVLDHAWPKLRSVTDTSFAWEKSYVYRVISVTKLEGSAATVARYQGEIIGDASPSMEAFAHDIFPPAAPVNLQAVAGTSGAQSFIDVTWAPNTENDLAGYNVYRHTAGQPPAKINGALLETPSFRDSNVAAGQRYFYSVTALDLRNNEGPQSQETSETVSP